MIKLIFIFLININLSEKEAIKMALSNPLIKAKIEEIKSSDYDKRKVFSSFFPQISSSFSYSYSTFVDKIVQPVLVGIDPITFQPIFKEVEIEFGRPERRILNVSLDLVLFSGFQRIYLLKMMSALKSSKIKEKELKEKELEILISTLYTQGLFLKRAIEKQREIINILSEHIEVAKKRYESGFALELDVLSSEVEKKRYESQLADFESFYIRIISSIKTLCNIKEEEEVILSDTLEVDTLIEEEEFKRIDVEVMKENLRMLKENKKSAYSEFFPKVFGGIDYIYSRPYGIFRDEWGDYFQYFIGVSFDIFDFGRRWNEVKKRESEVKNAEYILMFMEKKAREDLRASLEEFKSSLKSFKLAEKTLELARKSLLISREQYEKGFISNRDFLDVLRKALEAEILYLSSISKLKEAKLKYKASLYGVSMNF